MVVIETIRNIFKYSTFEIYFTLTLGVVASILVILSLLSWICLPSFLLPSDIIFIILCGTLLDLLTLIITAGNKKYMQSIASSTRKIRFPKDFKAFVME
jgi:hypothetical protein